ncbi:HipA domain-containing protein [Pseudomonas brassicacearum]|uniref:HipA domain-containing protein n=1 Tax=Pseudomonas brassicacearum TaxID=930166 RepID=UPI003ED05B74
MKYVSFDISNFIHEEFEPLGTKAKYWCSDAQGNDFLFKSIETHDSKNNIISRDGEDWSEKVSCEIAKKLLIPCADYELAHNNETRGVITKNFITRDNAYLVTGNEILKNYSAPISTENTKKSEKQNIMHIYIILRRIIRNKPLGFNSRPSIKSASDFFTGYLMLDALISNQDRHSENWGLIVTGKGRFHLAPSFDHAAGLGRNESDDTKINRLTSPDQGQQVSNYVKRAKSYFYLKDQRLRTFKAFEYFGILNPKAALSWLIQLDALTADIMQAIIDPVPAEIMSDVSKRFALEMLLCNKSNMMSLIPFFKENLDSSFRKRQIKTYE